MNEQLTVVSVTPHGRRGVAKPMWHVVLRRTPGAYVGTDLYLTEAEMAARGIAVPTLTLVEGA